MADGSKIGGAGGGKMIVMLGVKMRALALVPVIIGALAALTQDATAQSQAVPQDVALAIEEAIRLSDLAAANAAFSANIANHGQPTGIADRTRLFIAQSSLAEAVVEGIARHPGAAAAIVSAAVSRAPGHGRAIAHRATIAFPRFADLIAAAAGLPPPRQTPPALPYLTPPPIYAAAAPQPFYGQPAIRTAQAVRPAAVAAPQARDLAASSRIWPDFGISELRFGVVHHDTGVFGRTKEGGVDITLGVRFLPLRGDIWELLRNPRPFIDANINTEGNTHALDFGLNWDWDFWSRSFFSWAMGGAAHTGKTSTSRLDRKELGSHVLFYLAAELGYRLSPRTSLSLRLDHMSNASIADNNEGLDTVGVVYGYHF
jgi:hypothetical protein